MRIRADFPVVGPRALTLDNLVKPGGGRGVGVRGAWADGLPMAWRHRDRRPSGLRRPSGGVGFGARAAAASRSAAGATRRGAAARPPAGRRGAPLARRQARPPPAALALAAGRQAGRARRRRRRVLTTWRAPGLRGRPPRDRARVRVPITAAPLPSAAAAPHAKLVRLKVGAAARRVAAAAATERRHIGVAGGFAATAAALQGTCARHVGWGEGGAGGAGSRAYCHGRPRAAGAASLAPPLLTRRNVVAQRHN